MLWHFSCDIQVNLLGSLNQAESGLSGRIVVANQLDRLDMSGARHLSRSVFFSAEWLKGLLFPAYGLGTSAVAWLEFELSRPPESTALTT